jgi:hypothetical protein
MCLAGRGRGSVQLSFCQCLFCRTHRLTSSSLTLSCARSGSCVSSWDSFLAAWLHCKAAGCAALSEPSACAWGAMRRGDAMQSRLVACGHQP